MYSSYTAAADRWDDACEHQRDAWQGEQSCRDKESGVA